MNSQTFPIFLAIILLLAGAYSTHKKLHQIFCFFEGEDGTKEFKWMTDKDGWVIFRGRKYKIMTERLSTFVVRSGINYIFPTKASYLSFTWESAWPRDPRNHNRTVIDPKVRKNIDLSSLVESFFKTSSPAIKGKQGFLVQWLPIIAIGLVVILGFWTYSNFTGIAKTLAIIQNQMNAIIPR